MARSIPTERHLAFGINQRRSLHLRNAYVKLRRPSSGTQGWQTTVARINFTCVPRFPLIELLLFCSMKSYVYICVDEIQNMLHQHCYGFIKIRDRRWLLYSGKAPRTKIPFPLQFPRWLVWSWGLLHSSSVLSSIHCQEFP